VAAGKVAVCHCSADAERWQGYRSSALRLALAGERPWVKCVRWSSPDSRLRRVSRIRARFLAATCAEVGKHPIPLQWSRPTLLRMPADGTSSSYLVECYWPGINDQDLAIAARRIEAAATQLRRAGADVWFLGSILMPADETVFCLFHGNEPAIRAVGQRASIPIERVVESRWLDPDTQDVRPAATSNASCKDHRQ
jgi:hypothetical protein